MHISILLFVKLLLISFGETAGIEVDYYLENHSHVQQSSLDGNIYRHMKGDLFSQQPHRFLFNFFH